MPACITHANCRTYFSYFWCSNLLSTHMFSKVCFPLLWEAHFRKTISSTSDQTHHFFAPWTASRRALFAHLARSWRSFSRSDRYFSAFWALQKRLWLESRARFASRARSAATTAYIIPANLWISYATYCFLCIFTAAYTLLFAKLQLFHKSDPRPRWEAQVWKRPKCEIIEKVAVRASS